MNKREPASIEFTVKSNSVLKFPLAHLSGYDPKKFLNDPELEELDGFVLTLGLIFNDLKTLILMWEINRETKTFIDTSKISQHLGQVSGIDHHLMRLQISVFRELLVLIEKSNISLQQEIWERTIKKLSPAQQQSWKNLSALALKTEHSDPWLKELHQFLVKVRAHGGFHYNQMTPLMQGYKDHFSKDDKSAERAYVSLGQTFEETRFYFSDAASVSAANMWVGTLSKNFNEEFGRYLRDVHQFIRAAVETYMNVRQVTHYL